MRDVKKAAAKSGRYSSMVAVLRRVLPLAVLVVLGALVVWPMLREKDLGEAVKEAVPNVVVENLRLSGTDKEDRQYLLTAKRASQAISMNGLVDLEQVRGDIALKDDGWLAGTANLGRYDQKSKKLWLGGGIQMFHDGGYTFSAEEAQIDLGASSAWSEKPVTITWGGGIITGSGFRVLDAGNTVVIEGKSRLFLKGAQGRR